MVKVDSTKDYYLELTPKQRRNLGFYYDVKLKEYVYKFPVYLYKHKPLIFCKLGVSEDDNKIWYTVCTNSDVTYAAYYDRYFGKNLVTKEIDRRLKKKFKELGVQGLWL